MITLERWNNELFKLVHDKNMTVEQILQILKFIKPKFYNKLTWLIVISGILLIAKPLWEDVIISFLKKQYDINIAACVDCSDYKWGFFLILSGLIYNFLTTSLMQYIENTASKNKSKARILRIDKWRDDIESCKDSLTRFYKTNTYLELNNLLTESEKEEIKKNHIGDVIEIHDYGQETMVFTQASKVIICYKK
jgi:hypothetical protein